MTGNSYGAFRCRLPRKPWIKHAEIIFYYCDACHRLLYQYIPEFEESYPGNKNIQPCCCDAQMRRLLPARCEDECAYEIFGGFNNNAIRVEWSGARPELIILKTYTGLLLKEITPDKKPPVIFPLADEDAYAYCDREVCIKCLYCCKKSCVLYYYYGNADLRELPLDQVDKFFHKK